MDLNQKSTNTAGLALQSIIAKALDDDNFVLMASLDLSAAFDVVNVELLLKRLKIVGLPEDIIELIKVWLSTRYYYVNINGNNSNIHILKTGIIPGSILGPILYAIYIAPMYDLEDMTSFADDTQVVRWNKLLVNVINEM